MICLKILYSFLSKVEYVLVLKAVLFKECEMKLLKLFAFFNILLAVNVLAEDCGCTGGDNNLTIAAIIIDGNMDDWVNVIADPDNGTCDSSDQTDYDINLTRTGSIQSTGRNLTHFSWTGQNDKSGFVYGYTEREGSNTNVERFIFYKDGDADGLMETGDIALVAEWKGSTGTVHMEICDYVVNTTDGNASSDPMVWQTTDVGTPLLYPGGTTVPLEWVGQADGYTIHGGLTNCRVEAGLNGSGSSDGLRMEWQVPWKVVNMTPFQPITYHVSTMNAAVNANNPPGQVDDNMGSCPLEINPPPVIVVLDVNKTVSKPTPYIGDGLYYTIAVTNNGSNVANNVVVHDALPAGAVYLPDWYGTDWTCSVDVGNNTLDCNFTRELGVAETTQLFIPVIATGSAGDTVNNEACAHADENATEVCDTAIMTILAAQPSPGVALTIDKGVSDPTPLIGDTVVYGIIVSNVGDTSATNVEVNDLLPTGVTYISSDATLGSYNSVTGVWAIPTLAAGATATLLITVTVDNNVVMGATVTNEACATADQNTTAVCDDASFVIREPNVILTIQKLADLHFPGENAEVIYTIVVNNTGYNSATNVIVTDTLPDGVTGVSAGGNGWICDDSALPFLTCENPTLVLVPGLPTSFDINVTVDLGTSGTTIINTACIDNPNVEVPNCAESIITIALTQTIGDYVWYDDNNNGIQDAGEEPVEGMTVELLDISGSTIASQSTDASGMYSFDVVPGTYSVRFSGLPANYTFAKMNMGTDDSKDSDADSNGYTQPVIIGIGADNFDLDAGIYCNCNDVKSNSSPAMNQISAALMILMTIMLGLFFTRREEQLKKNER